MRRPAELDRIARPLAAAVLLLALSAARSQQPETDWIDEDRVENGEIQLDFGEDSRFRGRIRAAVLVEATPQRIWDVLRDCEAAPDYLDNVLSCELVETLDGGRAQVFRQRAKLRWFLPSFEHEFRLDYDPYRRIVVSRVSGPLKRLDAVWWLLPESETRTRVVYRLDLEPGRLLPKFLLTAPLRRDVRNALAAVRERAEMPIRPGT